MNSNFKKIFNKFSKYQASKDIGEKNHFLLIFFYPLILLFSNIYRLIFSYYYTLKLFSDNKKANEYFGYKPLNSINDSFYLVEELNLRKHGRKGISKNVSTGAFNLSNWWFLSESSLKLFKKLGSFFSPLFMIIWLITISTNIISSSTSLFYFVILLNLIICSSYFYAASFVFLNYNAAGWAFYPLFILFLLKKKLLFSSIIVLLISFASTTVAFISSILTIGFFIYFLDPSFLIIIFPVCINVIRKLSYSSNIFDSVLKIAKLIGFYSSKKRSKYFRDISFKNLSSLESLYFLITWGMYLICFFMVDNNYSLFCLLLITFSLHIINNSIFRFGDQQHIYMAMFTIGAITLIYSQSVLLLTIFWLAINPLPILLGSDSNKSYSPLFEKPFKPFHFKPVVDIVLNFLSPINKGSRILISLKDPDNNYSNLFIPYRSLIELLHYCANLSCILSIPDFWAISSNNQSNSIGFWGNEPNKVLENSVYWNTQYTIVIQKCGTNLDKKWLLEGFSIVSEIDWALFKSLFNGEIFYTGNDTPTPKWFLLKIPQS